MDEDDENETNFTVVVAAILRPFITCAECGAQECKEHNNDGYEHHNQTVTGSQVIVVPCETVQEAIVNATEYYTQCVAEDDYHVVIAHTCAVFAGEPDCVFDGEAEVGEEGEPNVFYSGSA